MNKKLKNLLKFSGVVGGYATYCSFLYGINKLGIDDIPVQISSSVVALFILTPTMISGYNCYKRRKRFREINKRRMEKELESKLD